MRITDLIFDYIDIAGFMSFPPKKSQKINLNTHRLTTIVGENLDIGDGERNGVGKSAIIDAILYLFFGRSPRVANQGFLNYVDPGAMFVVGEASRNGIRFRVERGENPSVLRLFEKPVDDDRDWRLKEDKRFVFETTKSTKPETTKHIVELMGFDLKLHDVLLVNNPSDRCCFFMKTEEEQRNIVERIFGFTVLTEKADNLRELRKEENRNLATKESALEATRLANDRVNVQIKILEEKSNNWSAEKDRLIKFLSQQIHTYQKVDFALELKILTEIDTINQQIREIDRGVQQHKQAYEAAMRRVEQWETQHTHALDTTRVTIDTLKTVDAAAEAEIIRKRETLTVTIRQFKEKIFGALHKVEGLRQLIERDHIARSRLQKQIEAIEAQVIQLHESKCPTCGQDWADTKDHILHSVADLDARNAEIDEIDTRVKGLKAEFTTAKSDSEKLQRQHEQAKTDLSALAPTTFKTVEEATRASALLEQLTEQLTGEIGAKNPHAQSIADTEALIGESEESRNKLSGQIDNKTKTKFGSLEEAKVSKQNFETVTQQFTELSQADNPHRETIDALRRDVLKEVDDSEVRELKAKIEHMTLLIKLLSDRDSPIRTELLHEWLPELNDRVNRYLEFLELPHRVMFDANMTANFKLNDKELSFGNLSKGQKLRVWLGTNRAFREIFELINYRINLFWVDEVLDGGMSSRGAEVSYHFLEQMVEQDKSLFLITHRNELQDMADHTMTIVLENGLSTILE